MKNDRMDFNPLMNVLNRHHQERETISAQMANAHENGGEFVSKYGGVCGQMS